MWILLSCKFLFFRSNNIAISSRTCLHTLLPCCKKGFSVIKAKKLIELKQQEINLKAQDLQRKAAADEAKVALDSAKLAQNEELTEAKLDSQEDIAQLRANVNLNKQKN